MKTKTKTKHSAYVSLEIELHHRWYAVLKRIASVPRNRKLGLTVAKLAALACEETVYREERRAGRVD